MAEKTKHSLSHDSRPQEIFFEINSNDIDKEISQLHNTCSIIKYCMEFIAHKSDLCLHHHQKIISGLSKENENKLHGNTNILNQRLDILKCSKTAYIDCVEQIKSKCRNLSIQPYLAVSKAKIILNNFKKECTQFIYLIYAYKQEILKSIDQNNVTVILSSPEYCKNTQVPLYLLDEYSEKGIILCCQPHHLSASCLASQLKIQMGESYCNLITCQVKKAKTKGFRAKVLFSTSKHLLSEVDVLNHASCIIMDESQYRSVETDILFAKVRILLKQRLDLKLIIMPTYNKASSFCTYFSNFKVNVISLPDISHPIQIVWKETKIDLQCNYIDPVVETVAAIHSLKEEGDIIVLLPLRRDIIKASHMLQQLLTSCNVDIPLIFFVHQDENTDKLLELFFSSKSNKRRVIFSAECAETSLDFPSVKYSIDSGFTKIKKCHLCESISTVCFISKETAKSRANHSGGLNNGTCYRLYNKENFSYFDEYTLPEVFSFPQCYAIFKLLSMEPESWSDLDLIENHGTYLDLSQLDLVKGLKLTPLGNIIATIPINPAYCKLLFLGYEHGIYFEIAILVSLMLSEKLLFINEKGCSSVEARKFSDSKGDSYASLNAYLQWLSVEKENEVQWCHENGINVKVMNEIHYYINQVFKLTEPYQSEKISYCIDKNSSSIVQNVIFECLKKNLCISVGDFCYLSVSNNKILCPHPSSLFFVEEPPKFVIYGNLHPTCHGFMFNITMINEELINNAVKLGKLQINLSEIEKIKLVARRVNAFSMEIIKRHLFGLSGEKLHIVEDFIKANLKTNFVAFNVNISENLVIMYTLKENYHEAYHALCSYLHNAVETVKNEEEITFLEADGVTWRILWGQGANIKTCSLEKQSNKVLSRKIRQNPKDAFKYSILVIYNKESTGSGWLSFPEIDFETACVTLLNSTINVKGSNVCFRLIENHPNQLLIDGLSPLTTSSEVRNELHKLLPKNTIIADCFVYPELLEITDDIIKKIEDSWLKIYTNFISPERMSVSAVTPPNASVVEVYLNFHDLEDFQFSQRLFNESYHPPLIQMRPLFHSVIFFPRIVVDFLVHNIDRGLEKLRDHTEILDQYESEGNHFQFSISTSDNEICRLDLEAHNLHIFNLLKVVINKLLEGEMLNSKNTTNLHKIFCDSGKMLISQVQRETLSHIILNNKTRQLYIYGSLEATKRAKCCIINHLKSLDNDVVKVVHLSPVNSSCLFLKAIIEEYGNDAYLKKFVKECELRSAELDVQHRKLLLNGPVECIIKAEEVLRQLTSSLIPGTLEDGKICELGLCRIPEEHSYALESCNHLYCVTCLRLLVLKPSIPLVCCIRGCKQQLVLQDIRAAIGNSSFMLNSVLNACVEEHIQQKHLGVCCTPLCPMIYHKKKIGTNTWTCPLCYNELCMRCGYLSHNGYSCEMHQKMKLLQDLT